MDLRKTSKLIRSKFNESSIKEDSKNLEKFPKIFLSENSWEMGPKGLKRKLFRTILGQHINK